MTPKRFQKFIDRDKGCIHCGEIESIAPHHRLNRGMGGSKKLDTVANIVVMCSQMNLFLETNPEIAEWGRSNGWKLRTGQTPETSPLWLPRLGFWALLGTDYDIKNLQGETNADYSETVRF